MLNIQRYVREGLQKGMHLIQKEVKQSFPLYPGKAAHSKYRATGHDKPYVRTGNLRRSIRTFVREEGDITIGEIGSNVDYASIQEHGGVIKPKRGKYLWFKLDGGWRCAKQVTIPARPFLLPAAEKNLENVKDIILNT